MSLEIHPTDKVQSFSWEDCLNEFPGEFLALRRAVENGGRARSTKVEWEDDFNYTQIFRWPTEGMASVGDALHKFLDAVNACVIEGVRGLKDTGFGPIGLMGGMKFFGSDDPHLRCLQSPVLLRVDENTWEWLAEVSLEFPTRERATA